MRARIVRGAAQIGGSMVELAADGMRLVLDAGLPLDADPTKPPPLPRGMGLEEGAGDLCGLIVTHGHLDHFGLLSQVHPSIPIFMGADAHRLLREAAFFSVAALPADHRLVGELQDRVPLRLGPFVVTPYLVDHSAIDAYGLLVEADGARLFYSGDLRAHGKTDAWQKLLDAPPRDVDALLLEGTRVTPEVIADNRTEDDVRAELRELMATVPGNVGVVVSSQNLDRVATIRQAALEAERTLVGDLYVLTMCAAVDDPHLPRLGDLHTRAFVSAAQRQRVRTQRAFERTRALANYRVFDDEPNHRSGAFVFVGSTGTMLEAGRNGWLQDGAIAWSLWSGYLTDDLRRRFPVRPITVHASGHAHPADLRDLAEAIHPGVVVPIHTNHPEAYVEHFSNVIPWADGKWITVAHNGADTADPMSSPN